MRVSSIGRRLRSAITLWDNLCFRAIVLATLIIAASFVAFQTPAISKNERGEPPTAERTYYIYEKPSYVDKLIDPISIFTFVLAVSTIFLWKSTKQLAVLTRRVARDSARAQVILEEPVVFIKIGESGIRINNAGPTFGPAWIVGDLRYSWINYGRTPAVIVNYADAITPREPGTGFPEPIDLQQAFQQQNVGYGLFIPPIGGMSEKIEINIAARNASDAQRRLYLDPGTRVFLTVVARYRTIFDELYVCGFCFQFNRGHNVFELTSGGPTLNFCRKENNAT